MKIKITALDPLFFRGGKPFTMGENTFGSGVFPPYPSVLYGALRSAYFAEHPSDIDKALTKDDPTKNLVIKGIYYSVENAIYLPLPYDCVGETNVKNNKVSVLSMKENEFMNNAPTKYISVCKDNKNVETIHNGIVEKLIFQEYLKGAKQFQIEFISDFVTLEPKIGIAIDRKRRSSKEGMLYQINMQRLEKETGEKFEIILDFYGLDLPKEGLMKLGGEGKAVYYSEWHGELIVKTTNFVGNRFKLYLSTPAIFEKGWIPAWLDEETLTGKYNNLTLKLLTAVTGNPIGIGGFDIKNKKPKTMFRAVPSGSVYYFEIIEGDIEEVIRTFHGNSISDYYKEQGFGIVYVGKI